ncbi:hypothetical protein K6Y31_05005 [Motilimonas cestriensis]|uniref:Mor transcription activator domain-containing protein n=1 Tax=Motilimonas cestriensis TaxID=2742685 RepID=A0ABS8W8N4_9GAMM|nr:Mor transcription activator family protein [Motilimonas cestriensis]MCE2594169.1 hypothetical protein [Motilimonas cestriensis]
MTESLSLHRQCNTAKTEQQAVVVLLQSEHLMLQHFGFSNGVSQEYAQVALRALAECVSRRTKVFPSLMRVRNALRNRMVIEEAKARPKKLIGKKYNISELYVYRIVSEQARYQSLLLLTDVRSLALDNISDLKVAAGVDTHFWPSSLVEMADVLQHACRQKLSLPEEQVELIAKTTILALASHFGGRNFYLPSGKGLETALRHDLIYHLSSELSVSEIGEKFELSDNAVRHIIKKQKLIRSDIAPV